MCNLFQIYEHTGETPVPLPVSPIPWLYPSFGLCQLGRVKSETFAELKREEARQRMAALRRARRSPAAARKEQRAASLFGDASKWRITNLAEVLTAMADSVRK